MRAVGELRRGVLDALAAHLTGDGCAKPAWMAQGECRNRPAPFFPSDYTAERVATAKALCARCEVASDCLAYALADSKLVGIWAGTTPDERRRTVLMPDERRQRVAQLRSEGLTMRAIANAVGISPATVSGDLKHAA